MTSTHVRRIAATFMLAALATTSLSARTLLADIPFTFSVSNRTMSAGQYLVSDTGTQHMMLIRNTKTGAAAFMLARPNHVAMHAETPRLAFSGCRTMCRLSEIKLTPDGSSSAVPVISIAQ